jgi:hypothetical protein
MRQIFETHLPTCPFVPSIFIVVIHDGALACHAHSKEKSAPTFLLLLQFPLVINAVSTLAFFGGMHRDTEASHARSMPFMGTRAGKRTMSALQESCWNENNFGSTDHQS